MQANGQADLTVLRRLFDHNSWANLRLLDYCEPLSEEQLGAMATGTYGAIRDTLHHIVGAELSYVFRVNGKLPDAPFTRDRFPGFPVLKQVARWTSEELYQLAVSAGPDDQVEERAPEEKLVVQYPLASLIMQAINHSTEHRTQVSTILTQLGLEPPDMTGWGYMVDLREFREFKETEA